MASLASEGDTLGQKHQQHNKLVQEIVLNKQAIKQTLSGEDDIQNLIKIDVACKTRNVEFLLEVLKSEDLLYVTRAINNCKWLITDKEYSHIVNPEYLYTQLSPEMTSKAFNKLMLSIRHNLKDEERAEAFFTYTAERNPQASYKWLQHCSVTFIENETKKHADEIPFHIMLRLIEKSFSIFEVFMKTSLYHKYPLLRDIGFLAKIDPEKYLDVLEAEDGLWINFSPRITDVFMKKCPNRIIDKFEFYAGAINLPTFVKYLKEIQDIKTFLLKHAENEKLKWIYTYKCIVHFIKHMPKESRFEFVKTVFIDKEPIRTKQNSDGGSENYLIIQVDASNQNIYQWYKFAPFDVAFTDLTKLIRAESSISVRTQIIQVLLLCASRNITHVQTVLKYYNDKHINEPYKFKIQFINTLLSKTASHEFDKETWGSLNQLFQSIEVYVESHYNTQACIKAIIVRHIIRGEKVPDIINTKFTFDSLKQYQTKLKKQEEKDAIFTYLYEYLEDKYNNLCITTESEFMIAVQLCEKHLHLLKDWKKDLQDYPIVYNKIKNLLAIKKENSWDTAMYSLYHVNNTWKKLMFNESISLCMSEDVCVNALKYDPRLLVCHKTEVDGLLKDENLLLRKLLQKVRIYWSNSLAKEWKIFYLNQLENPGRHKALITGLCILLPQNQLNDIAEKHAPSDSKINWNEIDELVISLQKQIAKNISKARPLPALETVLRYTKGDYLQYAVPSLNSVLSQLSASKIRKYMPLLMDAPVSLQKFGIRYAFDKLNSQELKTILTDVWSSTKNLSVRTVLFTHAHALLCKKRNASQINDIWELLSMFIDNLNTEEERLIYKKLGDISDLPLSIRPQFFMKSYAFLNALPAKNNCASILRNMQDECLEIMEFLDDHFVVNIMLNNIDKDFTKKHDNAYCNGKTVASFILCCKDEETAIRRYEMFLAPLLDRNLPLWYEVYNGEYHVRANVKEIFNEILNSFREYNLEKKMYCPVQTFMKIKSKLETELLPQKDYVFLTSWKLAVEFIKLLDEHKDVLDQFSSQTTNELTMYKRLEKFDDELHVKLAPYFAKNCIHQIKTDLETLHPTVFIQFSNALEKFFESINSIIESVQCLEYLKCILQCSKDKEVYIMVYKILASYLESEYGERVKEKVKEIRKILFSHPSDELKFYFYQLYDDYDILDDAVKLEK